MGVSALRRLFISRNDVCNTAYALWRIHEQNSIFKYTTMDPKGNKVFVCLFVLRFYGPVMSSAVSLPNHTFTGQA